MEIETAQKGSSIQAFLKRISGQDIRTYPAGTREPNSQDIYDTLGNVRERCRASCRACISALRSDRLGRPFKF